VTFAAIARQHLNFYAPMVNVSLTTRLLWCIDRVYPSSTVCETPKPSIHESPMG
jgi:hypothetical protein